MATVLYDSDVKLQCRNEKTLLYKRADYTCKKKTSSDIELLNYLNC